MMKKIVRKLAVLALLAATACQAGDSGYNSAIEGVVLEEGTNKPIAGAFVIAEWTYYSSHLIGSTRKCARIEIVKTDEYGRYKIPAVFIAVILGSVSRQIDTYKAGYEEIRKENMTTGDFVESERQRAMRPYSGTTEGRFKGFQRLTGLRCGDDKHYYPALIALQLAAHAEASTLSTEGDRHIVARGLRGSAQDVEFEMKAAAQVAKGGKNK